MSFTSLFCASKALHESRFIRAFAVKNGISLLLSLRKEHTIENRRRLNNLLNRTAALDEDMQCEVYKALHQTRKIKNKVFGEYVAEQLRAKLTRVKPCYKESMAFSLTMSLPRLDQPTHMSFIVDIISLIRQGKLSEENSLHIPLLGGLYSIKPSFRLKAIEPIVKYLDTLSAMKLDAAFPALCVASHFIAPEHQNERFSTDLSFYRKLLHRMPENSLHHLSEMLPRVELLAIEDQLNRMNDLLKIVSEAPKSINVTEHMKAIVQGAFTFMKDSSEADEILLNAGDFLESRS